MSAYPDSFHPLTLPLTLPLPPFLRLQAVSDVMAAHTLAYFSYEHRTYPQYDPRQVGPYLGMRIEHVELSIGAWC